MAPDGPAHLSLGSGREFDAVRALLLALGPAAAGVGGDCAELRVPPGETLCVSTDTSVEGVHFRLDWLTPAEVGCRATVAALSDLAAAGASPLGALLAVTLPDALRSALTDVGRGVGQARGRAGTVLVGGDTVRGGELSLTVTVLGTAPRPLRRDGARAGDIVYVTGRLGGPAAAVRAWLAGGQPLPEHRARFASPAPRIREARWLAAAGASAAVDVSDGLAADLAHVAAASAVRVELDLDAVPRVDGVTAEQAATGGEEYEVAVTAPRPIDTRAFELAFGIPLTRVGVVSAGAGVVARRGARVVDLPGGHDHFSP